MEDKINQLSTFTINDKLYGIDVMRVQEITKPLMITNVPLAPKYVHGLINLRGQISTAISLRDLFQIKTPLPNETMNVVCKIGDILISFIVDTIGEVIEVDSSQFEEPLETIPLEVRTFIKAIYKTESKLLSILDVDQIMDFFVKTSGHSNVKKMV